MRLRQLKECQRQGERKGFGSKEGISHLLWVWGKPKKNLILPPTAKKEKKAEAHTYILHTLNSNNNKLLEAQADQTRIDLSQKERVTRGKREKESQRKIQRNCFYPCVARGPAGLSSLSLSLPALSLPTACFSLSPYLSLHQSPSAVLLPVGSAPSSPLLPPSITAFALSTVLGVSHPCRQQESRQRLEIKQQKRAAGNRGGERT